MNARLVLAAALALTLLAATSEAQQVKKGTISGTIVTASAEIPAMSCAPLYAPAAGDILIITQLCGSTVITFEFLPSATDIARDTGASCTSYAPGLAMPAGDTDLGCCNATTSAQACTMTGVISKK